MPTNVAYVEAASGYRARAAQLTEALGRFPLSIVQLLFRLAVASVFLKAGLNKIASWELTVQLFRDEARTRSTRPGPPSWSFCSRGGRAPSRSTV